MRPPELPAESGHKLADNVMQFVRTLRAAGLPIGPGRALEAIRAVEATGLARRDDFYWTLHSVLVNRRDQFPLFDQAFHLFWKDPQLLEKMMGLMLPRLDLPQEEDFAPENRVAERLREALLPRAARDLPPQKDAPSDVEIDASMTFSDRERLQTIDFESMTQAELAAARRAIARLRLPIPRVPVRRSRPDPRGARIDMRATLRATLRAGHGAILLKRKSRRRRPPPLVVLCDISGSMERYSRMMLHFVHALTNDRDRVSTFVFGTRLTNITRQLRQRDVDLALVKVAKAVADWSGGTRIGETLHEFNRRWSRRVAHGGPILLLISDGLDQAAGEGLGREMERLHKSVRRLVWLNPLLRYDAFEPKSKGIQAMLPHVDEFRPVHNLKSLAALAAALEGEPA
ncbi:MAG: VWA domain-containing protein [Alphaproteobacteria bacterium]|nr:VWA domain-containing protein [Alphaproteobacteria bacterium]